MDTLNHVFSILVWRATYSYDILFRKGSQIYAHTSVSWYVIPSMLKF